MPTKLTFIISFVLIFVLSRALTLQGAQEASGNLPSRSISPNDLLSITVYGSPELTRLVRVGTDGLIRLPMLTRKVIAAGMLPQELEERLADALTEDGILVDPAVTVAIAEYSEYSPHQRRRRRTPSAHLSGI